MFAKKIAVPVLMTMLILLGGCTVIMKEMAKVKLDRPLPEQPAISAELKKELASKDMKEWRFHVRGVQYFGAGVMPKLREDAKEIRTLHFTKEFPLVTDPPPDMKELGEVMVHLFANELRERGYRVSDKACAECLGVALDYSYRIDPTFVGAEEVLTMRPNMYYGDVLFAQGWDDTKRTRNLGVMGEKKRWALKAEKEKEVALAPVIKSVVDEMVYVLKKVLGKDAATK